MASIYCSNCGAPVHPEAKFCSSCGRATAVSGDEPRGGSAGEPERPPVGVVNVTHKKDGVIVGGVKAGTTGCVGCATFVFLAILAFALLIHH